MTAKHQADIPPPPPRENPQPPYQKTGQSGPEKTVPSAAVKMCENSAAENPRESQDSSCSEESDEEEVKMAGTVPEADPMPRICDKLENC